ncbi:MAG: hypothetical protein JXD23_00825 [Spirochaetales bacterium]|nr:hypothetical protein [Spirochaetales bacterium]
MKLLLFVPFLLLGAAGPLGAEGNGDLERLQGEAARLEAALAEAPGDHDLLLAAGRIQYDLGAFFGASSGREAAARLEAAYLIDRDPVTKAFLGAAYAYAAGSAGDYLARLDLARRAMRCADEAAAERPDDPLVRLLRAEGSYFLPDMFERSRTADADLEYLFARYQADRQCFAGLFDPALVFYVKARMSVKERLMDQAYRYALAGRKIAADDFVKRRLAEFLKGFEE